MHFLKCSDKTHEHRRMVYCTLDVIPLNQRSGNSGTFLLPTFLMNRLSWRELLSSFSSNTDTSHATLWTHKESDGLKTINTLSNRCYCRKVCAFRWRQFTLVATCRTDHTQETAISHLWVHQLPGSAESGGVVASVDEWREDGQNQQTYLWILHQGEGQQRLQEGWRQRRQQVTAFITLWHLGQRGGRNQSWLVQVHVCWDKPESYFVFKPDFKNSEILTSTRSPYVNHFSHQVFHCD